MSLPEGALLAAAALAAGLFIYARRGGVKPAQAADLARQSRTFILDVRTEDEYAGGHLERAKLIPVQGLAGRLSELPSDKQTPILVYCAVGGRSAVAAGILKVKGYEAVHDLAGGINAWLKAGFPVVR
jgi:rhodanese-related sulfurtransferase